MATKRNTELMYCHWCMQHGRVQCTCACGPEGHTKRLGVPDVCVSCCNHRPCSDCGEKCKCKCPRCIRCGVKFMSDRVREGVRTCTCCPARERVMDTCSNCCGHACCRVPVRLVNRGLAFLVPTSAKSKEDFPYDFLNEEQSERVLFGQYGTGKLNLRRFCDNKSRRFASVEIEVARSVKGGLVNEECHVWNSSIVRDGSVNGGAGYEINTTPACGDALYEQLTRTCDAITRASSIIDRTCGLHTHFDARDYGYQEIQRLMLVWHRVEPVLFAACKPDRAHSRFCRVCGETYFDAVNGVAPNTSKLKRAIMRAAYNGRDVNDADIDVEELLTAPGNRTITPPFYRYRTGHRNGQRYNSLNLHTWFMRGTVENRMHHGTFDFNEIWMWTKMQIDLLDAVARTTHREIVKLTSSAAFKQVVRAKSGGDFRLNGNFPFNSEQVGHGALVLQELVDSKYVDHLRAQSNVYQRAQ